MRSIPSIEQLRQRDAMRALETRHGRAVLVEALRVEAAALRARAVEAGAPADPGAEIEAAVARRLATAHRPSLRRTINATGVIVHTNLGRAPLPAVAAERAARLAAGYTNLEYDIAAGARGKRDTHAESLICRLTGAEAAVVVNNTAAATMLVLAALGYGREVIISRGELVEIGGGFRVPDVMAQSGAVLREVGTTNRTRAADYAAAISDRTALILRVHPSNFRIEGFTERPPLEALTALGTRFNLPVVEDLGSGYLGGGGAALRDEPVVQESIAKGASVVMFSGDKLLGGPQAGIVAGTRALLSGIRTHPLMRALRVDKLTYAALEATLEEHVAGRASQTVPVWRMLTMGVDEIAARAEALIAAIGCGRASDGHSTIGGGSAPGSALPTRLVAIDSSTPSVTELESRLRASDPAVIARIEDDRLLLDLRTVDPADDAQLIACLRQALS
ncbi:MAG TPA: L-seryl-tRNA(Sec) selenium transferase [Vicinamibacterales bacterium]